MEHAETIRVRFKDREVEAPGIVRVCEIDEAAMAATKLTAIVFGATLFSIIIPFVHFISVPLGLIAVPFVWYKTYQAYNGREQRVCNFLCLECHQEVKFSSESRDAQINGRCSGCGSEFVVLSARPQG